MDAKDILTLSLKDKYRMIVVSDIHGNLKLLRELLEKVDYCKDDYLFILGDIIEKGKESPATLDYIYKLAQNENVWVIRGNVDRWCDFLVHHDDIDEIMGYINYRPINIFTDWARLEGFDSVNRENHKAIAEIIKNKYSKQLEWLRNLPLAIETEDFIFVHAGIENIPDWKQSKNNYVLFCEEFCKWGHQTDKWVIVGHWPAYNYPDSGLSWLPFINNEKKIISVDGGLNVKYGGQLNALIVDKNKGISFSYNAVDDFPKGRILINVAGDLTSFTKVDIRHPRIEVIEKGEHFSKCRMLSSGKIGLAKNEHIFYKGDGFITYRSLSDFISVKKEEIVSIVDDSCTGYTLVRSMNAELGWIPKEALAKV